MYFIFLNTELIPLVLYYFSSNKKPSFYVRRISFKAYGRQNG